MSIKFTIQIFYFITKYAFISSIFFLISYIIVYNKFLHELPKDRVYSIPKYTQI